jgi:carbon dioxide concentrating mechanism protein CcmN
MYLPPLQPVANSDIRICGDVEIHPTASIASGVILQAAPNSKIIIGVDACIGMGVIITAYGGVVEIADGATLGSGVLIVGHSKVGSNACVGTTSTIFNASVDSMKVITPGSIIGDVSRQATEQPVEQLEQTAKPTEDATKPSINKSTSKPVNNQEKNKKAQKTKIGNNYFFSKNQSSNNKDKISSDKTSVEKQVTADPSDPWLEKDLTATDIQKAADIAIKKIEKDVEINGSKAMGKIYIDQLLITLFPHKKHFDNNSNSK